MGSGKNDPSLLTPAEELPVKAGVGMRQKADVKGSRQQNDADFLAVDAAEPDSQEDGEDDAEKPAEDEAEDGEAAAEEPEEESAQKDLSRPSAEQIYEQVARNAKEELKRTTLSLFISGITGGTFMGLSALGVAIIVADLGNSPGAFVLSRMLYPLGFIVVILGRSQLFTENTLYPVALVLSEKREFWNTMRLWATVLPANIIGAFAFSALISLTGALSPPMRQSVAQLGLDAVAHPASAVFWSGVMGGWIIATTAWLVSGSHSITGSVMVIWLLTFVVGLGNFAHCIATSGEILTAVLTRHLPWAAYPRWFGPAVAGNICGGVLMVTLLEYGQTLYGRELEPNSNRREA